MLCVCASRRCCYLAALGAIVMFYRHYYFLGPFNINRISQAGWPLFLPRGDGPKLVRQTRRAPWPSAACSPPAVCAHPWVGRTRKIAICWRSRCWKQPLWAPNFALMCREADRTQRFRHRKTRSCFFTQRASVTNGHCVCVECAFGERKTLVYLQ